VVADNRHHHRLRLRWSSRLNLWACWLDGCITDQPGHGADVAGAMSVWFLLNPGRARICGLAS
jgi:hypothetical protein